jgi:acetylglutamate kinase
MQQQINPEIIQEISDDLRVQVLTEALPYIQKWRNEIMVIKYGGAVVKQDADLIKDILFLTCCGFQIVVVHGGGPLINEWLKQLNKSPQYWEGIRVTDKVTMEIVEMVLAGKVNKQLVGSINANGGKAIGLCGKDANLIVAKASSKKELGLVGEIEQIHPQVIDMLLEKHYIPVIASVAASHDGTTYNLNADVVAGELAIKLKAKKLIFLTDTKGILADINNENSVISTLNLKEAKNLANTISGGMIPKVNACICAVENGVEAAHIIGGKEKHQLLLELLTEKGRGSMIVA